LNFMSFPKLFCLEFVSVFFICKYSLSIYLMPCKHWRFSVMTKLITSHP
jgi:hypothetical protein